MTKKHVKTPEELFEDAEKANELGQETIHNSNFEQTPKENFSVPVRLLFRTAVNSRFFPKKNETLAGSMPSETIPDQSMSVQELVTRHAQGLPLDGAKIPVYHGEDFDIPDFKRMDLAELQDYRTNLDKYIQETRQSFIKANQDAQRRAAEKVIADRKAADQRSTSERTTGENVDQGKTSDPDSKSKS